MENDYLDDFLKLLEESTPFIVERIATMRKHISEKKEINYLEMHLVDRIEFDRTIILDKKFNRVFEDKIFSQFTPPYPITSDELAQIAFDQFGGTPPEALSKAGLIFFGHVKSFMNVNCQDAEPCETIFDLGRWSPYLDETNEFDPHEIWISESEYFLMAEFYPDSTDYIGVVKATLWGQATPKARMRVGAKLAKYLPSIAKSVALVFKSHPDFRNANESELELSYTPSVDYLISGEGQSFFSKCVSRLFHRSTKKIDSLKQRFQNAIDLLVLADEQESHIVGLSLCFSAIEALVCENPQGIVKELSRRVVALLQPDGKQRPDAIKNIIKLYNFRSNFLHGINMDECEQSYVQTRTLAAAVLRAVVDWQTYQSRMGDESKRKDFLSQLKFIEESGQKMIGDSGDLSRLLPEKL